MSPSPFQPADVVRLRSGGPPMTVELAEGGIVACGWFEGTQLRRGTFPPAALHREPGASEEPDRITLAPRHDDGEDD